MNISFIIASSQSFYNPSIYIFGDVSSATPSLSFSPSAHLSTKGYIPSTATSFNYFVAFSPSYILLNFTIADPLAFANL